MLLRTGGLVYTMEPASGGDANLRLSYYCKRGNAARDRDKNSEGEALRSLEFTEKAQEKPLWQTTNDGCFSAGGY